MMVTEKKIAYRVGFKALQTKEFKEFAFLGDNFLLIVGNYLFPTMTFSLSGKEYEHNEICCVPKEEENKLLIKTNKKKFEKSNYIELFVFTEEENLIKRLEQGISISSPILGLIYLCLGERALDHKVVEDGQTVTLTYDTSIKEKMSINSAPGIVSPDIRAENSFTVVDLFPNGFDDLNKSIHKYVNLKPEMKKKMNIALRWFFKGISERVIEDKYLAFWIAFEIVSMEGSTNISKAKRFLEKMLNIPIEKIDEHFTIGKLFGIRSDLVHGRDVTTEELWSYCQKLQDIVQESLKHSIFNQITGSLKKYCNTCE